MKNCKILIAFVSLLTLTLGNFYSVNAQGNLAQQVYAIFEQNCLNCHGEHGHLLRKSSLSIQHSLKQARLFRENR